MLESSPIPARHVPPEALWSLVFFEQSVKAWCRRHELPQRMSFLGLWALSWAARLPLPGALCGPQSFVPPNLWVREFRTSALGLGANRWLRISASAAFGGSIIQKKNSGFRRRPEWIKCLFVKHPKPCLTVVALDCVYYISTSQVPSCPNPAKCKYNLTSSRQDWSPHEFSFSRALKSQPFNSTAGSNPRRRSKNREMNYKKAHIVLNLCMNYMVHVSSTLMWRNRNQPSNSTSCGDKCPTFVGSCGGHIILRASSDVFIFNLGLHFEGLFWGRYTLKGQIVFEGHWRLQSWTFSLTQHLDYTWRIYRRPNFPSLNVPR